MRTPTLRRVPPTQAETLLSQGRAKYEGGDRMGALRLWELALEQAPTPDQRRAALFNAAAVHASFGDLELAQIPLKDGASARARGWFAVEEPAALPAAS